MVSSLIKNGCMLLALAGSQVVAEELELAGESLDLAEPPLRTFGYNYAVMDTSGNLGVDLTANFDLGGNYELPMYSQAQYYVTRQRGSVWLGGRQIANFLLYIFRLKIYVDVWPVKTTFENYLSYDILGDGDVCLAGMTYFDTARIQVYMQLDYQDCGYGVLGVALNDAGDCSW